MKRITIVAVLALFSAVASTGCLGQTGSSEDGTTESTLASNGTAKAGQDPTSVDNKDTLSVQLELKLHPDDESQGPHPEPWLDQQGPHPEPWTGRKLMTTDPNAAGASKP